MMEALTERSFSAKVLLFGEYSVIHGGSALAIPYSHFSGKWMLHQRDNNSMPYIQGVKKYLLNAYYKGEIEGINFDLWERAIGSSLHFESNIPMGSGMGSSGALTAAIYDAFVEIQEKIPLHDLKMQLAFIESYFHGKSSGIDPLVSYLNTGVLVTKDDVVSCDVLNKSVHVHMGLLNSGSKRNTEFLVQGYLNQLKDEDFKDAMGNLSDKVDDAIEAYQEDNKDRLFDQWKSISQLQYEVMGAMIPENIKSIWAKGLDSGSYYFKLCGAGGGGYFLFWSVDKDKLQNHFPDYEVLRIQ